MLDDFDMLAATLVHEIKNPLALVRANLDYIELCDTEKRYANSYTVMKRQLERTDSLLQEFVGLVSSVCAESESTDICIAIRAASADYNTNPRFNIELHLPAELYVNGNGRLLRIVFSNIIKNAMEAGAQRVKISAEAKDGLTRVTVTDDGAGLSEEALMHIGISSGYTTKKYGNGLGVLISKRIIAAYGGKYTMENAATGGCVVTIELVASG